MDAAWTATLLQLNLIANALLLTGALWCIAFPSRRIYPMTSPDAWYYAMWALFGFVFHNVQSTAKWIFRETICEKTPVPV